MTLTPLYDRLLVEKDPREEVTEGGILLPDSVGEGGEGPSLALWGTVRAAGPGRMLDDGSWHKPAMEPGDRVCFSGYAGTETEHGVVIRDEDVLAVQDE